MELPPQLRRKRGTADFRLTGRKRAKKTNQVDDDQNRNGDGVNDHLTDNSIQKDSSSMDPRNLVGNSFNYPADSLSQQIQAPRSDSSSSEATTTHPGDNDNLNLNLVQPDSDVDIDLGRLNITASGPTLPVAPPQISRTPSPPPNTLTIRVPPSNSHNSLYHTTPSPTYLAIPIDPTRYRRIQRALKMSRRLAAMPAGTVGAPANVPQLFAVPSNLSTDSTDSQNSIRTQVPGKFHQSVPGNNEPYFGQIDNGALPFATPDLNSASTFSSVAPVRTPSGLNPNSIPFAPPGGEFRGNQFGANQFAGAQFDVGSPSMGLAMPTLNGHPPINAGHNTQIQRAGHDTANGGYGMPQQRLTDYGVSANNGNGAYNGQGSMDMYQQQNAGNMGGYHAANTYGQGMGPGQYQASNHYGQNQNSAPHPYNSAPMSNSYGQYGQGAPMGGYGHQGAGQGQGNGGYGNTDYAVGGQNQPYQNNQYGSGTGNGYEQQGQQWGGQYQNPRQAPIEAQYVNPSNANRGKSAYIHPPNTVTAPYNNHSNFAPAVNYNQGRHPEHESYVQNGGSIQAPSRVNNQGRHPEHESYVQNGGSIQAHSRVNNQGRHPEQGSYVQNGGSVQAPSRVNSTSPSQSKFSAANSSAEQSSSNPSMHGGEQTTSRLGSPEPLTRLTQEFSSEPRNNHTPILRSRHMQTAIPATDPISKPGVANWLDNVQPPPPPKMLSLDPSMSNLSGGDILARVRKTGSAMPSMYGGLRNDIDPFTVARTTLMKPTTNFFAPSVGGGMLPNSTSSPELRRLTANGKPSVSEALDSGNLPLVEYCRNAREDTWGVIKIKNIPYSVNRPEVLAFLGRNARIINEQEFEPVHIVMERVTSKTLDCYVEFINFAEAVNAVNRFETNRSGGRGGRLGQRHVEVELSCQEQLMHDLFPKAKNVTWAGSRPIIKERDFNDETNSGFQGFISKEELVMLVKHVEAPQRSPFSKDCPQRPFECLISTLLKYPWYMVDHITIEDRNELHRVTLHLIELLMERIASEHENINLTPMLLKRVWRAALKCPGFSPAMKDDICWTCGIDDQMASEMGVPAYAAHWKQLWTIGPKPGAPTDFVLWYAAIIRETIGPKAELTLAQKAAKGHQSEEASLFGELVKLVDLPKDWKIFQTLSLSQVAAAEWAAIEQALRRALTPALTAGPSA